MKMSPVTITFTGEKGAGKSTLMNLVGHALQARGLKVASATDSITLHESNGKAEQLQGVELGYFTPVLDEHLSGESEIHLKAIDS